MAGAATLLTKVMYCTRLVAFSPLPFPFPWGHKAFFSTLSYPSPFYTPPKRNRNGVVHLHPIPNGEASNSHSLPGVENVMMEYICGQRRATLLAHRVWMDIVKKGDIVIDATCGNGYDTLALLKMVADHTKQGRVYGMDVQKVALENTSLLIDRSVNPHDKELVELFSLCHSRMGDVIPEGVKVRLVAFNLGYLPGADKKIITKSETTLRAIEAAKEILMPGGLISIVAYVGHSGGREEFDKIEELTSRLPFKSWNCCKLQMLNRPLAPVLVFLRKR
ncbi:unnamed protein product [Cuscuta epithymum]|uniref:rRNA methylase YtqB n=1 Tax=Cuscuta epithymum TaxID=186058 RepID=A0AAV0E5W0_9ASTE|nr:unnamed protein product [Cuscuta epithymum]